LVTITSGQYGKFGRYFSTLRVGNISQFFYTVRQVEGIYHTVDIQLQMA